jgi:hypothetical protein
MSRISEFISYLLGDYYPITCLIGLAISLIVWWFEKRAREIEKKRKK